MMPQEIAAAIGSVVTMLAFYPFLRATDSLHLSFTTWAIWCIFSAAVVAGLVALSFRDRRS